MKRHWMIAAMLLSAMTATATAQVKLEQKYPPGLYEMTIKQAGEVTMDMAGQKQKQATEMLMVAEMKVNKPDDKGNRSAVLTYKRIKQVQQAGAMKMEYDSADPEKSGGQMATAFKPLLKAKITMTIDKNNKVKSVKGFDSIWDELVKDNPQLKPMADQMKKQFSGEMLERMMGSGDAMLPDKAVKKGDTWQSKQDMAVPMLGEMKMKHNCKLKELKKVDGDQVAVIAIEGDMKSDKPKTTQMGPNTMTFKDIDIDQKGAITFNADQGYMVKQVIQQVGGFSMTIKAGGNEMNASAKMDMTTTVDVDKKK